MGQGSIGQNCFHPACRIAIDFSILGLVFNELNPDAESVVSHTVSFFVKLLLLGFTSSSGHVCGSFLCVRGCGCFSCGNDAGAGMSVNIDPDADTCHGAAADAGVRDGINFVFRRASAEIGPISTVPMRTSHVVFYPPFLPNNIAHPQFLSIPAKIHPLLRSICGFLTKPQ